jgi:hypothetical protein
MSVLLKAVLLFGLNLLDALLTLIWVQNGLAEEGNALMAHVLAFGSGLFLFVKIAIGILTLLVFYRWSSLRITQIGVSLALGVYLFLMGVHAVTCYAAIAN